MNNPSFRIAGIGVVALAMQQGLAVASPLPLANCKALVQSTPTSLAVVSGAGTPIWTLQTGSGATWPSLSQDALKVAYVSETSANQLVIASSDGAQFNTSPVSPNGNTHLTEARWDTGNSVLLRWDGKASSEFQYANLTKWPAMPALVPDGVSVDASDCTRPAEGGRPVCADGYRLQTDDSTLATFDHVDATSQPRTSLDEVTVNNGSSTAVPNQAGLTLRVASITGPFATMEFSDPRGTATTNMQIGDEYQYAAESGDIFFVVTDVQPSLAKVSIVETDAAFGFGAVAPLANGVLLVSVSGAQPAVADVWQKSGAAYVKRLRVSLPRADETLRLRATQPSVLGVEDAAGFYEAPYSLILSGGAVVGMSFGALVRRPSFVNGAPVLDWNCF